MGPREAAQEEEEEEAASPLIVGMNAICIRFVVLDCVAHFYILA